MALIRIQRRTQKPRFVPRPCPNPAPPLPSFPFPRLIIEIEEEALLYIRREASASIRRLPIPIQMPFFLFLLVFLSPSLVPPTKYSCLERCRSVPLVFGCPIEGRIWKPWRQLREKGRLTE